MSKPSKNINHGDINTGGSVHIGDLKIQHILGNLQDYQNLEQEIEEAREVFNAIALDKQEVRLKLSGTLEAKKEKLENIKKAIEQAFEYISKLTIRTDRLDQAKALFLEGDIPGALEILRDEAIQADYLALQTAKQSEEERHSRRMEEIAEKTKGIAEEWKMKAVLMATHYEDRDWFEKTKRYYELAMEVERSVPNLFDYAQFLFDHKQYVLSTPIFEEALAIMRLLVSSDPHNYLPNLAMMLNNSAVLHSAKNEEEQAQKKYEEALSIERSLAQNGLKTYLPDLAMTLNNLAVLHRAKNELGQAQKEYEEALIIYRSLAQSNLETFLPDVAMTLNNLANVHSAKNEFKKAKKGYNEALTIYRSLIQKSPQIYLPYLGGTLNNLGNLNRTKNKLNKAQVEYEEALAIYRSLAKNNPVTFLPDVALSLNNLGVLHSNKNELDQALNKFNEALVIRRFLVGSNPDAFLPYLATTLNNLALTHSAKNELCHAQKEYEEALIIYRSLSQINPGAFSPDLAMTAVNMAIFYQHYQPDKGLSLKLVKEALQAAVPFEGYLKYAQDSIEMAISVIVDWGLDVVEFLKDLEQ